MPSSRLSRRYPPSPTGKYRYAFIVSSCASNLNSHVPPSSSGCAKLSPLAACTVLYNVVDSPVGIVPVTRVDPKQDTLPPDFVPGAAGRSAILEKEMYTGPTPAYDPVAMAGIPVGVQIVGKKWEDEKVLEMMKVVDEALGMTRGFGPGTWKAR